MSARAIDEYVIALPAGETVIRELNAHWFKLKRLSGVEELLLAIDDDEKAHFSSGGGLDKQVSDNGDVRIYRKVEITNESATDATFYIQFGYGSTFVDDDVRIADVTLPTSIDSFGASLIDSGGLKMKDVDRVTSNHGITAEDYSTNANKNYSNCVEFSVVAVGGAITVNGLSFSAGNGFSLRAEPGRKLPTITVNPGANTARVLAVT